MKKQRIDLKLFTDEFVSELVAIPTRIRRANKLEEYKEQISGLFNTLHWNRVKKIILNALERPIERPKTKSDKVSSIFKKVDNGDNPTD